MVAQLALRCDICLSLTIALICCHIGMVLNNSQVKIITERYAGTATIIFHPDSNMDNMPRPYTMAFKRALSSRGFN